MWPRTGHDSAVLLGEDMGERVPERSETQQRSAVLPGPDAALGEAPASGAQAVAAKAASENFPVALRMLPRTYRRHLMAVYVFARTADDLGDQAPAAERSRLLAELEADVRALYGGGPPAPGAGTRPKDTPGGRHNPTQPVFYPIKGKQQGTGVRTIKKLSEPARYMRPSG